MWHVAWSVGCCNLTATMSGATSQQLLSGATSRQLLSVVQHWTWLNMVMSASLNVTQNFKICGQLIVEMFKKSVINPNKSDLFYEEATVRITDIVTT